MKKLLVAAIAAFGMSAQALTFETGQVLTTNADGTQSVVDVAETSFAQSQIEQHGYVVFGGVVVIGVGDDTVSIPTHELANKSFDEVVSVISDKIVESGFAGGHIEIQDVADQAAHEAASAAAQEAYQAAVEAAVYADNIANGVAEDIAAEASQGFTFEQFCSDPNADGDKSGC